MLHILENEHFQLKIHPQTGTWDLICALETAPSICGARLRVSGYSNKARFRSLENWENAQYTRSSVGSSRHGQLEQITVRFPPDAAGVVGEVVFASPAAQPLLLWKVRIANQGNHPVHPERIVLLRAGSRTSRSAERPGSRSWISNLDQEPAFFSNGWGSWDHTGVYGAGDRFQRTRLGPLTTPMRVNPGTPQPRQPGHFASDMFAVIGSRITRRGLVAGFLSQKEHFGSLEARLTAPAPQLELWANGDRARLDPGAAIETDWACLGLIGVDDPDPLSAYLEAVAREHGIFNDRHAAGSHPGEVASSQVPTGWCSWYQYYQDVSADDIQRNLETVAALRDGLPLDVVQIDDGFQTRVGDWFDFSPGFPDGVAGLAEQIRDAGQIPGLWLAPFIVGPRSRLRREHADWLVRGRLNRAASAGFSTWGGFTAGLDLTHPDALEYTKEVAHSAVHRWGFPYLKLDFLYAGAIQGERRDPTRTRARVLREGLRSIRAAVGDQVTLLGCGCPLGSGIGILDAMRIGADVDGVWLPNVFGLGKLLKDEPGLPSARNAIHNTLTRAFTHRRWWVNDPDCLLLRPDTSLSIAEVQSLATAIALSGGSLLISDDLVGLPAERLDIARAMLPLIGLRPRVLDWFDSHTPRRVRLDLENDSGSWHLLGFFNWLDEPVRFELRLADYQLDPHRVYLAREFWTAAVHRIERGSLTGGQIPPHGAALIAVREQVPGVAQYIGSGLHVSQGLEVVAWQAGRDSLRLAIERPHQATGQVVLQLPRQPAEALLNGRACRWKALGEAGFYLFSVEFEKRGELVIRYRRGE